MKNRIKNFLLENKVPLTAYLTSRFIVFSTSHISISLLPVNSSPGMWRGIAHNTFIDGLARWDSGWYRQIAKTGYTHTPLESGQVDSAFFPLYPLLMSFLGQLFGGKYLPAGIFLSNLFFLVAVLLFWRWSKAKISDENADLATWLLCFFPTSFFFSAAYSESMFLLLAVASFYFSERKNWWLAVICAGLTSAVRIPGLIVSFCIILMFWWQNGFSFKFRFLTKLISLSAVSLSGILAYCTYLYIKVGNPLIFVVSQKAEGWAGSYGFRGAYHAVMHMLSNGNFLASTYDFPKIFNLSFIPIAFATLFLGRKLIHPVYIIFCLLMLIPSVLGWTAFSRYIIVIFPLFPLLANLIANSSSLNSIRHVIICLLTLLTATFCLFRWVA